MALVLSDALERKLRGVYDALDDRSYKSALRQLESLSKKHPTDPVLQSLLAYTLSRLESDSWPASSAAAGPLSLGTSGQRALDALRALVAQAPVWDRVLSTLALSARVLRRPGLAAEAYERAVAARPLDADLLKGLLTAQLHAGRLAAAQRTASQRSRALAALPAAVGGGPGSARMQLWAAAALSHFQAREALLGGGEALVLSPVQSLGLAQAMLDRQLQSGIEGGAGALAGEGPLVALAAPENDGPPLLPYEAVLLHLDVLQARGRSMEAAELLRRAGLGSGTPILGLDPALVRDGPWILAAALVRAGRPQEALAQCSTLLDRAPDDWLAFQLALDCLGLPAAGGPGLCSSAGSVNPISAWPVPRFPVGAIGGLAELRDAALEGVELRPEALCALGMQGAVEAGAPIEAEPRWTEAGKLVADVEARLAAAHAADSSSLPASAERMRALMRLELAARRLHYAKDDRKLRVDRERSLAEETAAAFAALGSLASVRADLGPYARRLSSVGCRTWLAAALRDRAWARMGSAESSPAFSALDSAPCDSLQALCAAEALAAHLDAPDEPKDLEYKLVRLHAVCVAMTSASHPDERERCVGDDALATLVAGAMLRALRAQSGAEEALLRSSHYLTQAATLRPKCAPVVLSLAAAAALLGCPERTWRHLEALGVKNVMHDSVSGHLALPGALCLAGNSACGDRVLQALERAYVWPSAEAPEALAQALAAGSLAKFAEMASLRERLLRSSGRAQALAERAVLAVLGSLAGRGNGGRGDASALARACALLHGLWHRGEGGIEATEKGESALSKAGQDPFRVLDLPPLRARDLCFNDDLSARPAWFPPCPGGEPRLEILRWWERAAGLREGAPSAWWLEPGAAASSRQPQAHAWRCSRTRALARRRLLPAVAQCLTLAGRGTARAADVARAWADAGRDELSEVADVAYDSSDVRPSAHLEEVVPALLNAARALEASREGSGARMDSAELMEALARVHAVLEALVASCARPELPAAAATAASAAVVREEAWWVLAAVEAWRGLGLGGASAEALEGAASVLEAALHPQQGSLSKRVQEALARPLVWEGECPDRGPDSLHASRTKALCELCSSCAVVHARLEGCRDKNRL